jgi:hypothetical protein
MAAVARFLRHTPIPALRAYFQASAIGLPDTVDWAASDGVIVRPLLAAVEDLDEAERVHVWSTQSG